jgi:hypothetical protein
MGTGGSLPGGKVDFMLTLAVHAVTPLCFFKILIKIILASMTTAKLLMDERKNRDQKLQNSFINVRKTE